MTPTMKLKWREVAWPDKGHGHRFFKNSAGTLFMADLSGPNPDLTHDGPLAPLPGVIRVMDGVCGVYGSVRVLSERAGRIFTVVISLKTAAWLKRESGLEFTVECSVPGLRELLS